MLVKLKNIGKNLDEYLLQARMLLEYILILDKHGHLLRNFLPRIKDHVEMIDRISSYLMTRQIPYTSFV